MIFSYRELSDVRAMLWFDCSYPSLSAKLMFRRLEIIGRTIIESWGEEIAYDL